MLKYIFSFLLVLNNTYAAEFEFAPVERPELSISFQGETQAGTEIYRFEVRKLGYYLEGLKELNETTGYYIIYYAGNEYGPTVLHKLEYAFDPFVQLVSDNQIEVEYSIGAKAENYRQLWKLNGHEAKLIEEKSITSDERRHFQN